MKIYAATVFVSDFQIRLRTFGAIVGVFICLTNFSQGAGLRQLPLRSIEALRLLSKEEFDARFPGTLYSQRSDFPEGWYTHYQHESLEYFFGPARFRSTSEGAADELSKIVESAREVRQALEGYAIQTLFLPEAGEPRSEPEKTAPPASAPPPPPSWLDRLLGIFRR